jgi:rare lipoprotein A
MPVAPHRIAQFAGVAFALAAASAACHRTAPPPPPAASSPLPEAAGSPAAATPTSPQAAGSPAAPAASSPADTATGKLPDFEVDAVSTEEGNATWYDVPAGSLAQRRAWPEEMTAASDKHPPNTYVRVTRSENGKSVIVRITDHHIGEADSIIDLDRTAAEALGMIKAGKTHVKIEVLALKNADAKGPSPKASPFKAPGASQADEKAAAQQKSGL